MHLRTESSDAWGIIDEINQLGRKVIFLGDGVPVFKPYIEEHIQVPHSYAPIHLSQQRAGAWCTGPSVLS